MNGKLIDPGRPRHYCKPPGWRERRRLGVDHGAIWACECGAFRKWESGFDGGWYPHYPPKVYDVPILDADGNPQPPPMPPA